MPEILGSDVIDYGDKTAESASKKYGLQVYLQIELPRAMRMAMKIDFGVEPNQFMISGQVYNLIVMDDGSRCLSFMGGKEYFAKEI